MSTSTHTYPKPHFLAVVIWLCGIALVLQGFSLIQAGGSFYYRLAGLQLATVINDTEDDVEVDGGYVMAYSLPD